MYAIEFETSIQNGIVQIPNVFHRRYSNTKAKIIIMIEDDTVVATPKKPDFIEMLSNKPRHLDESTDFLSRE